MPSAELGSSPTEMNTQEEPCLCAHSQQIRCISQFTKYSLLLFPLMAQWGRHAGDTGDPGSIPGSGRSAGGGKWQPTLVLLPGEISWTQMPGGLQSIGLQRVGHS